MVQAILAGDKCCTRRIIKKLPDNIDKPIEIKQRINFKTNKNQNIVDFSFLPPKDFLIYTAQIPFKENDILYVRETWNRDVNNRYLYKADCRNSNYIVKWKPSIHMPKEAARIFLKVTSVSVHKLQTITTYDIYKEGIKKCSICSECVGTCIQEKSPLNEFKKIWDSTLLSPEDKKKYSWDRNPFVVAYEFTVMDKLLTL